MKISCSGTSAAEEQSNNVFDYLINIVLQKHSKMFSRFLNC